MSYCDERILFFPSYITHFYPLFKNEKYIDRSVLIMYRN